MKMNFKQKNIKLAIAAGMLVGSAGLTVPAYATTDTSNMDVTANIGMNCTITTTNIAFDEYKPTTDHAETPLTAQGSVTTTCTVGSSGVVIIGQGLHPDGDSTNAAPVRRMEGPGEGDYLGYQVYSDSEHQNVWTNYGDTGIAYSASGSAQEMPVYGSIAGGQTSVPQGSYSDTLVVTVNY